MMQILSFLFHKRLYPVWIAGQIWVNMANGGVIVIQDDDHNWGSNDSHEISYCLIPAELADPNTLEPKLPVPYVNTGSETILTIPEVTVAAGDIEPEHVNHNLHYLLYLLKRPPPRLHFSV